MRHRFLAVLLSALTGVGGHYLNGRWDKAALFLGLFLLWILAVVTGTLVYALHLVPGGSAPVQDLLNRSTLLLALGIGLLWQASLIVTFLDSERRYRDPVARWQASGIAGSVVTSLAGGLILFAGMALGAGYWRASGTQMTALTGVLARGVSADTAPSPSVGATVPEAVVQLNAVEVLIEAGLLDQAQGVLAKVNDPGVTGRKSALAGFLAARRGRCIEARAAFQQARAAGFTVPSYYQEPCPAPPAGSAR